MNASLFSLTRLFQLAKLGFTNLDALDGSQEMMDEAAKKNIYKKFILHILGDDPIPVDSSKYKIEYHLELQHSS